MKDLTKLNILSNTYLYKYCKKNWAITEDGKIPSYTHVCKGLHTRLLGAKHTSVRGYTHVCKVHNSEDLDPIHMYLDNIYISCWYIKVHPSLDTVHKYFWHRQTDESSNHQASPVYPPQFPIQRFNHFNKSQTWQKKDDSESTHIQWIKKQ